MNKLLEKYLPLRSPDDGGSGGGNPAPGGGDPAPGGGNPAPGGGNPAPGGDVYYPAGLPDEFKGSDNRATMDALWNAFNGANSKLNEVPKPPTDPKEYKLELSEKTTKFLGDISNDPLIASLPEIAFASEVPASQYSKFVSGVMDKMTELGAYVKQPNDSELALSLIDPKLEGDAKTAAQKSAMERITNTRTFVDGLGDAYTADEKAELTLMTTSKGGISLIEKLMAGSLGNTVNPGGGVPPGGQSIKDVIASRIKDPRGIPGPQFDKAFAEETRRLQRQHAG